LTGLDSVAKVKVKSAGGALGVRAL